MADRVYRDPVLGSIAFDWKHEPYIIELIDTPEFQRLRRIRQLGSTFLVFHGAEHSRFSHALGVAYLAKRMFSNLMEDPNLPKDLPMENIRKAVLAGALLHDVGHGPFSHLFERVFREKDHEKWGLDIIEDPDTKINSVLKKHTLLDSVKQIFDKSYTPRFARDIISSQLDADRLDYLLRDSYMTGVAYGRYDLDWLLGVIELAKIPKNGLGLAINFKKGWHAAEQFLIGRYLMYQQVYFHKTIRAAERMVKLIFERLAENAKDGNFPHFCPEPLRQLLISSRGRVDVKTYLRLDDELMLACFSLWSSDEKEEEILRDLCARLMRRDLFKTVAVDLDKIKDHIKYADSLNKLKEEIKNQGFNDRYYFAYDSAEDFPYKDMMWFVAKDKRPEDIWLAEDGEAKKPLSDVSLPIGSLRNAPIAVGRLCFAGEFRDLVQKHMRPYLSEHVETSIASKQEGTPVSKPAVETRRN